MKILFWISIAVLSYTYFGYPLYILIKSKVAKNTVKKDLGHKPHVSLLIAAHNEEHLLKRKIDNLLDSDYPQDRLEILVGSDGSDDGTNDMLSRITHNRVRPFMFDKRRGKASVLNMLVPKASGEVIVFCDSRQTFERETISHLVANFADDMVGCVSGELIFKEGPESNGVSEGVGAYWKYEKLIRKCESAIHSMVGATGAIYAIRKSLYRKAPKSTILDDVYIPLSIARRGYRCVWDSEARAYDMPSATPKEEYRRKVRTLAGNYQIFYIFRDLFIPRRSAVSMSLFSHKLLRVLAPFFMIALFAANLFVTKERPYEIILALQCVFYALALVGFVLHKHKGRRLVKLASTIYMFCLLNFTALVGLYRFIFGLQSVAWEK